MVVNGSLTALHGVALARLDIAGDGLALRLGEGPHHGQHQLCGLVHGVDVFFFKVDRDALRLQHSDVVQAVHRVAGEAGDGLDQDAVNESAFAVSQHPLEILPFLHRGAGDALVGIDVHQPPIIMLGDVLRIVDVLSREGI